MSESLPRHGFVGRGVEFAMSSFVSEESSWHSEHDLYYSAVGSLFNKRWVG